jgi:bifunctional DNase/RNase
MREIKGSRAFDLELGLFEITAIYNIVRRDSTARPVTHEAIARVISGLGAELKYIIVDEWDLSAGALRAKFVIRSRQADVVVDCRTSDALAVALIVRVPFFVAERILDRGNRPT